MAPTATTAAPAGKSDYGQSLNAVSEKTRSFLPKPPSFASKLQEREWTKFRLAQAFRIFGHHQFDEGVAGHITVRDPIRPDCFWVNPFGLHFGLIQAEDLLLVDHEGNIQEESGPRRLLNKAAFMIHSEIHAARPDVHCAAHSHSIYGRAFATLGRELDMITQDSCAFYNDHVLYTQFKGVVLDAEEGKAIAAKLGNKKAAILQNHGLLVCTPTIEGTVFYFGSLERCARVQLLADAAASGRGGETVKITPEDAANTYATVGSHGAGWFSGLPEFDMLEAREGKRFDFTKHL
ncbi:hypothetical protein PLICRDRAFT_40604 [Plicaturopsis crispa FD-325 SS-3]|nr:hypothetical protein PLICRDRAFT_40604 [Plicaturopsis crispa FD-325 SS-3]